jgi:dTDP-4-dehydrorhamnose 3,5-epimerase-like enzyme
MNKTSPYILNFPAIGESTIGFISIAENQKHIPFDVKRTFWTYFTPQSVTRGFHAHHDTEMVLVALTGKIVVYTEMPNGDKETFVLDQPTQGLYLPRLCWHTMQYSHTAIQLVLASTEYNAADYVRNYDDFLQLRNK